MADIDQIIAGGAGASSRANFSAFDGIADAFFKARDEKAKNDLRTAFKDGVPTDANGQPDFGAMAKTLFQKGGLNEGVAAANLGLQQNKLKYGQDADTNIQGGATPQTTAQPTLVSPPSANRTASAVVAPPLAKGGAAPQQDGGDQGGATVMKILAAQGIPNDQLGAASASVARQLGVDPTAPIDINDPQVRNVLGPAVQQLKRMGIGQVQGQPQGQPQQVAQGGPPQQAPQVAPPQVAQQPPQQPQAPPADDPRVAGLVPPGRTPQQQMGLLSRAIASGMLPPEQAKLYQNRIDAITKAIEPTQSEKDLSASNRNPGLDDYVSNQEAAKAAATEDAKGYVAKYNNIDEAGTKAIQEIPKLQTALKLMDSPDFYSGIGNNYNLALKRVAVALGGDTDKAAPQEIVGKVIADSVLNGLGSLKGLGPIRVAEMNLARTAAMSPDNTPQTNRFLANVAIRIQQRAVEVSDLAQKYKEENGKLDVGFDRQVRAIDKRTPVISPDEVQRFQSIIDGKEKKPAASAAPPMPGAKQAPDGNFYLPDPNRPGKYLKVVQ